MNTRHKAKIEQHSSHYFHNNCSTGKRSYFERCNAKVAARLVAKNGHGNLRPYVCNECHEWHIGHNPSFIIRGALVGA